MGSWAWLVLYLVAFYVLMWFWPSRVANGLSGKLLKRVRIYKKSSFSRYLIRYYIWYFVWCLSIAHQSLWAWSNSKHANAVMPFFWILVVVFILDDFIFGDDDLWKKFKEWSGNKIKWKMDLPEPVEQETA